MSYQNIQNDWENRYIIIDSCFVSRLYDMGDSKCDLVKYIELFGKELIGNKKQLEKTSCPLTKYSIIFTEIVVRIDNATFYSETMSEDFKSLYRQFGIDPNSQDDIDLYIIVAAKTIEHALTLTADKNIFKILQKIDKERYCPKAFIYMLKKRELLDADKKIKEVNKNPFCDYSSQDFCTKSCHPSSGCLYSKPD